MKKQYLEAGRIVNTHGVRGEVKIEPWADDASFLTRFKRFYLDGKAVKVLSIRVHKTMCIAALEGIDDVPAFILDKDADNGVVTVRLIEGM